MMNDLKIPPQIEKWIVAYMKLSKFEYDFYLRGVGIPKVGIKVVKKDRADDYRGEIRTSDNICYYYQDNIFSEPEQVVIQSLMKFISSRIELIHQQ